MMRKYIFRDVPSVMGYVIVLLLFLFMIAGPFINSGDAYVVGFSDKLIPPSAQHWFGTDELGRDIFHRMAIGSWYSFGIAFAVVIGAAVIGVLLGGIAGYWGGAVDNVIMRVCDAFMAFPQIFLAMVIATTCGAGIKATIFALAVSWWPSYARMVRGMVLSLKERLYVEAALAIGKHPVAIVFEIILPQTLTMLIPQITMGIGNALIMASGFSFIGLGAQAPLPEWGAMINAGSNYLFKAPWYTIIPGIFITLSVFGISLVGDSLQEATNPELRNI